MDDDRVLRAELGGVPSLLDEELAHYAGSGTPVWGIPGQPGARERVDFGMIIGEWVEKGSDRGVPTTVGIIHYGANGVHIVPARPATR
jgi:filamentous hemagglutinin